MKRSTLLHLRIPFSFFLMPFYAFAVSQTDQLDLFNLVISFLAVHLFLYPASNGYNSYFDRDEASIGGLEKPPAVEKELYYISLLFDLAAIGMGLLISIDFGFMLLLYGLASKAYSHPQIRFKKYPYAGLGIVVIFQGYFTYAMSVIGLTGSGIEMAGDPEVVLPGFLCSMLLCGSYPMTQIYQHEEDKKRGDLTISRVLGVKGTFIWTAVFFFIATVFFIQFLFSRHEMLISLLFPVFLSPVLFYFLFWFRKILLKKDDADWKGTMRLNKISSVCIISYFLFLGVYTHGLIMVY
jgi:1,4-dihydroxy-2-naphthoate octaprenyltransferase